LKIGVISDTHLKGCDDRLKRILDDHFRDVDLILHAGDIVDMSVLEAFKDKQVMAVCGNMDPPSVRRVLPDRLFLDIGNHRVGLCHGWGSPYGLEEKIMREIGSVDCLIYGHTHRAAIIRRQGVVFFNPGSATDRRSARHATLGILEIGDGITGEIIELGYT
jgi:putative phosphoesterase